MSVSTVKTTLNELEQAGFVLRMRRYVRQRAQHDTTLYSLRIILLPTTGYVPLAKWDGQPSANPLANRQPTVGRLSATNSLIEQTERERKEPTRAPVDSIGKTEAPAEPVADCPARVVSARPVELVDPEPIPAVEPEAPPPPAETERAQPVASTQPVSSATSTTEALDLWKDLRAKQYPNELVPFVPGRERSALERLCTTVGEYAQAFASRKGLTNLAELQRSALGFVLQAYLREPGRDDYHREHRHALSCLETVRGEAMVHGWLERWQRFQAPRRPADEPQEAKRPDTPRAPPACVTDFLRSIGSRRASTDQKTRAA
jgi:hypothetical protein